MVKLPGKTINIFSLKTLKKKKSYYKKEFKLHQNEELQHQTPLHS